MAEEECPCLTGPHHYAQFDRRFVGVDVPGGRFGEVEIWTCRRCGRPWLRYFWEAEGFTASGRWGCGPVSPEVAATVSPESALDTLEGLPFYFIGGSYFGDVGKVRGPGFLR